MKAKQYKTERTKMMMTTKFMLSKCLVLRITEALFFLLKSSNIHCITEVSSIKMLLSSDGNCGRLAVFHLDSHVMSLAVTDYAKETSQNKS